MLPVLTPSEFVDLFNQTLEVTYPIVSVEGELKNFKISKDRWVYFDLVDSGAKIKCFGTVYKLPGPVEEGMVVKVIAYPRLHHQFGFSLNFDQLILSGEGTIKKAQDLLKEKLTKEGLFLPERKRSIPFPPERIGLITSAESAAYTDFVKILSKRSGEIEILLADVNVQGATATEQIVRAIEWFNKSPGQVDVIVITRGGGDIDDLQAYSTEQVVRAVSASRTPTMIAIGHEKDVALAELAADQRASTPSNAAELLVPDRKEVVQRNVRELEYIQSSFRSWLASRENDNLQKIEALRRDLKNTIDQNISSLDSRFKLIERLSPRSLLKIGYSIVRVDGKVINMVNQVRSGQSIEIELSDDKLKAEVL